MGTLMQGYLETLERQRGGGNFLADRGATRVRDERARHHRCGRNAASHHAIALRLTMIRTLLSHLLICLRILAVAAPAFATELTLRLSHRSQRRGDHIGRRVLSARGAEASRAIAPAPPARTDRYISTRSLARRRRAHRRGIPRRRHLGMNVVRVVRPRRRARNAGRALPARQRRGRGRGGATRTTVLTLVYRTSGIQHFVRARARWRRRCRPNHPPLSTPLQAAP